MKYTNLLKVNSTYYQTETMGKCAASLTLDRDLVFALN